MKKFYNTFTNAIRISEVENGESAYWNYAPPNFATSDSMKANDDFFNKYLFPYMKGLKKCNARQNDYSSVMVDVDEPFKMIDRSRFIFEDGSCFNILSEGNLYNRSTLSGIFDYNCNKKPNKGGKNQFYFYIYIYIYIYIMLA